MSTDRQPPLPNGSIPTERLSIFLLVRALGFGGTERQVVYLAKGLARRGHRVTLASFYPDGPFEAELVEDNLERLVIGKRGRGDVFAFLWRLGRAVAARQPDVIYGFLPVPNLLTAATRIHFGARMGIVWGIRGTPLDPARYDWLERASIRLERLAARVPDLVIANSRSGKEWARGAGFDARRVAMVANGIDTAAFCPPSAEQRAAARAMLGCPADVPVVAVVGRIDPMKDHETFLEALATAARAAPELRALIVGSGAAAAVDRLRQSAETLGIGDRVIWSEARRDVARVYHAADLLCLPSAFGEGFPNVVGEAMATGLSCIVTAVGDSAELVGDTGKVVPPRCPELLARAILDCVRRLRESGRHNLAARRRIVDSFGIEAMVSATEDLLLAIAGERRRTKRAASFSETL